MRTKQWLMNGVVVGGLLWSSTGTRADEAGDQRLNALDQKVRILERKLELGAEEAAQAKKETATVTAGKEGFALSAPDKSYQLKLRGYLQADGRFFVDDSEEKAVDTFVLRRARVILDGTLGKQFEFRVAPDFGGGKAELQDGYLDYKRSSEFNVRFGRTKVPFGIERLQSSADTLFNEAGLSTALTPNYDVGVMPYGALAAGTIEYALGVFNGGPDGASVDADSNDDKDVAARLFVTPFRSREVTALKGLSFGIAGTLGKQEGTTASPGLPSIKSSGQQTIFSYKTSTNTADVAFADGDRTRIAPQVYYNVGSFGLLGEYAISEQKVANGKGSDTVKNEAWQVAASYVLTGESPSLKGVKPLKPFNPAAGGWGAFELAARVGGLEVDDAAFSGGYADTKKSVSEATNAGVGFNWYLTGNTKLALDFENTAFTDGDMAGDRPDEQVVIARAQVSW